MMTDQLRHTASALERAMVAAHFSQEQSDFALKGAQLAIDKINDAITAPEFSSNPTHQPLGFDLSVPQTHRILPGTLWAVPRIACVATDEGMLIAATGGAVPIRSSGREPNTTSTCFQGECFL
eukprot:GEMP01101806.1.p1 GENE.GEMP01101806.1~~GEMP01101806.1.p1  ORF type:complete len:123 (-),score=28.96 GEMP01101806.1:182-550(-)